MRNERPEGRDRETPDQPAGGPVAQETEPEDDERGDDRTTTRRGSSSERSER